MRELASYGSLHPAVLLEGLVTFKSNLLAAFGSDSRLVNRDLAAGKDDVAGLSAMAVSALLTVRTTALLNFLLQEVLDDLQPRLGAQGFDLGFGLQNDLEHRQIHLKRAVLELQFGAGVGERTDVLFLHAVVGFGLFLILHR